MEKHKKEQSVHDKLTPLEYTELLSKREVDLIIAKLTNLEATTNLILTNQNNQGLRLEILSGRLDNLSEVQFRTLDEVMLLKFGLGSFIGALNVIKTFIFFWKRK